MASIVVALIGLVFAAQRLGINPLAGPGTAVAKPVNGPTAGLEEASAPLGSPPPSAGNSATSFRFESTQADGATPVTWSPCRPIHYVIRALHSPPGGREALDQAVATISVADSVILHELGHLVGLAHVNDPGQIMWPRGNAAGLTGYQPGDTAGLRALGLGSCQKDS